MLGQLLTLAQLVQMHGEYNNKKVTQLFHKEDESWTVEGRSLILEYCGVQRLIPTCCKGCYSSS